MGPTSSERPGLPTGPHPTIGPDTPRLPRWPGWVLLILGLLLGLGGLGAGVLVAEGQMEGDPTTFLWLAVIGGLMVVAGMVYLAVRQISVRRYLPPERYRGPTVVLLLLLVLVLSFIVTLPFGEDATALVLGRGELTPLGAVVLLMSTQAAMLAVSWLFVFRPRALVGWPSWAGPDPIGALRAGFGWGVLAWIGSAVISAAVVFVMRAIGIEPEPQTAERALAIVDPWLAVVAIVVAAPIAEELFFRGVVYNAWLREGGPMYGMVGSAALFAVIHLSLVALIPIFLLGLALAWVYRRTGNLLAPIAMHATVNGLSVLIALLVRFELMPMPA